MQLLDWMGAQPDSELYTSSFTLAETWRGVLKLAPGRKRRELEAWFNGPQGPAAIFAGRVLPFDGAAALKWAELMQAGDVLGRPRSPLDMILAATAKAHDCTVVTLNDRHFRGVVPMFNPVRDV